MSKPPPLGEVFARAIPALRQVVPFERAELVLLDARAQCSPRLWPSGEPVCIRDARAELDGSCEVDRRLLDAGVRSVLAIAVPDATGGPRRPIGAMVFAAGAAGAFEPGDAARLGATVELLAVVAEHDRRWAIDDARQRRRARLEALLPALADALDVRRVFLDMSAVIRDVVAHDILALALLAPDRGGVRVQAATHAGLRELPEYRFTSEVDTLDANWNYLVVHDMTPLGDGALRVRVSPRDAPAPIDVEVRPDREWVRFLEAAGVRSTLRVPVRAKGRPIGGLAFLSSAPYAYDDEDGALASRIADHVALALAHQELAEEAQRMARAEERARQLEVRVDTLARELDRFSSHRAVGQSAAWKKVLSDAAQVAATDTTVLITGESGTGKEVVARYLHRASPRAGAPFVALNCAALPEQLLESELFGHERGAFTGALQPHAGKLEQAAGGVIFLDEVGEMSPPVQAKFLRVLQEREFQRLGGARTLRADVRIIAATNRDPRRAIELGAFREDLYYRLSVFEIHLPPLRARPDDILVLAEAFLAEIGRGIGRPAAGISEDARDQLLAHSWPGNVRELRNAIERAVILCGGGLVTREHLPITVARPSAAGTLPPIAAAQATAPDGDARLDAIQREALQQALAHARDNKTRAAKLLGLSRGQLYSLLRRHGLTSARR